MVRFNRHAGQRHTFLGLDAAEWREVDDDLPVIPWTGQQATMDDITMGLAAMLELMKHQEHGRGPGWCAMTRYRVRYILGVLIDDEIELADGERVVDVELHDAVGGKVFADFVVLTPTEPPGRSG